VNRLAASGAAAHVLVADLESDALPDADQHHLRRVLRLRPDTVISLGDGAGRWRLVRLGPTDGVVSHGPVEIEARPVGSLLGSPSPRLTSPTWWSRS
jgi:hypothetical protein